MKKIFLFVILSGVFLLTACGNKTDSSVSGASTPVSENTEVTESVDSNSVIAENIEIVEPQIPDVDTTLKMYADFLKEIYEANPDSMYGLHYGLAFIDDDEYPELVYMEDGSHVSTAHVCMAGSDGVWEIGEFGEYGSFAYVKGKGKVLSFYQNQGIYLTDFYSIVNRTLQEDKYFEIDNGDIWGDGETMYFVDGDQVTEEVYNTEIDKMYVDEYTTCDYFHEISYKDSYDVYTILKDYYERKSVPVTIQINDEILKINGEWHVFDKNENIIGSLLISEDGYVNVDIDLSNEYSDGETHIISEEMPMVFFTNINESGYLWSVGLRGNDVNGEYIIHYMENQSLLFRVSSTTGEFIDVMLQAWQVVN